MIEAFLYLSGVVSFTMILGGEPNLRVWFWLPCVILWPVLAPMIGLYYITVQR